MANTRELRRRIKSIKNTAQITKAMQLVAATKMRRAQNQATSGRVYSLNLIASLSRLLPKINPEAHPFLTGNDSKTIGVILLSTDKGLVGALNTNLIRILISNPQGWNVNNVVYYTVGRKGRSFVVRSGKDLKADFENSDTVSFRQAKQLGKMLIDSFKAGEIGQAILVYPQFVSTLRQEAKRMKLLPIDLDSVILGIPYRPRRYAPHGVVLVQETPESKSKDSGQARMTSSSEFLFEPDPDTLLDYLLVHHIEEQIYQALLETKASEHSARMMAMQSATDNALELVDDLTLVYNQTRQSAITKELLEITTAQAAME